MNDSAPLRRPDRPAVLLIGMPGCGKSTVGKPLAERLNVPFVDPDLLIIAGEGGTVLGDVSENLDREEFLEVETRYNLAVPSEPSVVAPGGSVIYCTPAMERFRTFAVTVWLDVPVEALEPRLGCLKERAVVIAPGATLHDLAAERRPLLEQWADLRIDAADRSPEALVDEIAGRLAE
ncbi:shikimate kinase [Alienimonas chondri]|uniref:Shikimate kinase n=1 Tax=Alienimonas chondri TaxID=2681879 RepID=A0ABX1VC67_9PLAN|nr:shikimate kinase [Alienimonas chondri]NNJ25707.1 Shikimate kinase 1 [Alienimonas chondri]